jgi:hypothetical protein
METPIPATPAALDFIMCKRTLRNFFNPCDTQQISHEKNLKEKRVFEKNGTPVCRSYHYEFLFFFHIFPSYLVGILVDNKVLTGIGNGFVRVGGVNQIATMGRVVIEHSFHVF